MWCLASCRLPTAAIQRKFPSGSPWKISNMEFILRLLRSKRAGCILTAIPAESILLLLNQHVEVGREVLRGDAPSIFFGPAETSAAVMYNERAPEISRARGGGGSVKPIEVLPHGADGQLLSGDNRRAQNLGRSTTIASAKEAFSSPLSSSTRGACVPMRTPTDREGMKCARRAVKAH